MSLSCVSFLKNWLKVKISRQHAHMLTLRIRLITDKQPWCLPVGIHTPQDTTGSTVVESGGSHLVWGTCNLGIACVQCELPLLCPLVKMNAVILKGQATPVWWPCCEIPQTLKWSEHMMQVPPKVSLVLNLLQPTMYVLMPQGYWEESLPNIGTYNSVLR